MNPTTWVDLPDLSLLGFSPLLFIPLMMSFFFLSSLPSLQSNLSISKMGKEKDQHVTDIYPYYKMERHKGIRFLFKKFTHKATHWEKKQNT